ncbi:MAG: integrin alpha [Candidatus Midichloria sp.]|nr:integrin alpha [Candidatus Midichloria sp.]
MASAGDINNDGINDIIIGAMNANEGAGQAYVIFGEASDL